LPHAAAAGDYEFLADLLSESAPRLINHGASRTLIHWAGTLPESHLMAHPEIALSTAIAWIAVGPRILEVRRLLQLVDRGTDTAVCRDRPRVEALAALVRSCAAEDDIGRQVKQANRAVELAERGAGELVAGSLAQLGRAQYLAGKTDAAWRTSLRSVENPEIERRPLGHALARANLAITEAERGRLSAARLHAERAQAILTGIGNSRTPEGARSTLAMGVVLAAEGNQSAAERQLALAESLLEDETATAHHTWALLLLARVRCRRGHLAEAGVSLRAARAELTKLLDGGRLPSLAQQVEKELATARRRAASGAVLEPPSDAELAVLRLLASDLSARQIGDHLFVSLNTVRSHTRALYRKLGVNSRPEAIARATELGLLRQLEPSV
jgi:LuxR family maltose regulon positive regulatory protein